MCVCLRNDWKIVLPRKTDTFVSYIKTIPYNNGNLNNCNFPNLNYHMLDLFQINKAKIDDASARKIFSYIFASWLKIYIWLINIQVYKEIPRASNIKMPMMCIKDFIKNIFRLNVCLLIINGYSPNSSYVLNNSFWAVKNTHAVIFNEGHL